MTTPEGAAAPERYGFGLIARTVAARPELVHGGTVPGFIAWPVWLPAEQLSIVVLMNTRPTPHTPYLLRDLARFALGHPATIVAVQTGPPPAAAALRPLTGTYIINVDGQPREVRFWVDGTTLMSQAAGQDRIPLRPAGPHAFGVRLVRSLHLQRRKRRGDQPDVRAKRLDVHRTAEALTLGSGSSPYSVRPHNLPRTGIGVGKPVNR
jgi:hypothetical protein